MGGKVLLRSLKICGSKNFRMESFPLRLQGLTFLERHDVQLDDDEFEVFLAHATKSQQMRCISLFGVVDSPEKRDFVHSLQDEFPRLEISVNAGEKENQQQ